MLSNSNSPAWVGALRFTLAIITAIFILSITTLGTSATYGTKLSKAPLDDYEVKYHNAHRWSTAYFVFYSATMPFLTAIHAILNMALYFMSLLQPVFALVGAVFFLFGWAVQVGFWTQCDISENLETASGVCYQALVSKTAGSGLDGVPSGLGKAKVAFGFILLFLYVAYTSFAAAAVYKQRKQRKNMTEVERVKGLGTEDQELNRV